MRESRSMGIDLGSKAGQRKRSTICCGEVLVPLNKIVKELPPIEKYLATPDRPRSAGLKKENDMMQILQTYYRVPDATSNCLASDKTLLAVSVLHES